jgi:hypothetical protein
MGQRSPGEADAILEAIAQTVRANAVKPIRDDPWLADTYSTS